MENYSTITGQATIGRRRHSRLRLCLPARLITLSGNFNATLVDLSRTGARIAVDRSPTAGCEAVLEWGSHDAFCTVAWFDGNCCGLRFEESLPQKIILATRQLGEDTPVLDHRRVAALAWATGHLRIGIGD